MKHQTLVFLASIAFFLPSAALAQTPVSAPILSDTVWTKSESPYLVSSDFAVEKSATLILI